MNDPLRIEAADDRGHRVPLTIEHDGPPWRVWVTGADLECEGRGDDLFEALAQVRRVLDPAGIRMGIAAARRNAWPGVHDRLFDGGRRVWLCDTDDDAPDRRRLSGHPCALQPADPSHVVPLAEQRAWHHAWLQPQPSIVPDDAARRAANGQPDGAMVPISVGLDDPRHPFTAGLVGWWRADGDDGLAGDTGGPFANPCLVELREADGSSRACELLLVRGSGATVMLWGAGCSTRVFSGPTPFAALASARTQLDARGARLLCQASCRDAWGRGPARHGVVRTTSAQPGAAWAEPFAPAAAADVGTVDEQRAAHVRWLVQHAPVPDETLEARARAVGHGHVHVIEPPFPRSRAVRMSVRGSWPVDEGVITGEFVPNPRFALVQVQRPATTLTEQLDAQLRERLQQRYVVPTSPYPLDGR